MQSESIVIPARFCGPPNSANGGYVAGRLAAFVGGSAEVTLKSPPPLDTALAVSAGNDGSVVLEHNDKVIAVARAATATSIEMEHPDFEAATAASARTFAAADHKVPGCFVCGPGRSSGDGLRIHVGPLREDDKGWQQTLAAPWLPPADLADADGTVRAEFVWAALDCPTAYACSTAQGMPPILLGRQTVTIERLPQSGERCVIVAKHRGLDGRKHYADAALLGAGGQRIAACNAIWIEVSEAQLNANATRDCRRRQS